MLKIVFIGSGLASNGSDPVSNGYGTVSNSFGPVSNGSGPVSKCCPMDEIFNAKSNVCEKGNFSFTSLTFFSFEQNIGLAEVADVAELDVVEFTHGLLEEEDCHGAGRK